MAIFSLHWHMKFNVCGRLAYLVCTMKQLGIMLQRMHLLGLTLIMRLVLFKKIHGFQF